MKVNGGGGEGVREGGKGVREGGGRGVGKGLGQEVRYQMQFLPLTFIELGHLLSYLLN